MIDGFPFCGRKIDSILNENFDYSTWNNHTTMNRTCYLIYRENKLTGTKKLLLTTEYPSSTSDYQNDKDTLITEFVDNNLSTTLRLSVDWLKQEIEQICQEVERSTKLI